MAANEWIVERLVSSNEERDSYVRTGDALVHRDAFVADDAALIGPVLVEAGARILAKAVVVGPTSIGRDATIESGVVVSRSVIWRRSTIAEGATVDRCVVADDAIVDVESQAFQRVITAEPQSELERDWTEVPAVLRAKEPVLGFAARFGRFVFGTSSPRSAAAQ
jgi:NDP-sugar pyrophosphorylase family protein